MEIQKQKIADKIVLLTFPTRFSITSSLVRFQAYYDSPEFRGKTFSLEEFKQWYTQNSDRGKRTGKFTFYEDWDGFNFPVYALSPFQDGRFAPLTDKEITVLETLDSEKNHIYTIGIHRELSKKTISIGLNHEIAHGLFYTDEEYRKKVSAAIESENLTALKRRLTSSAAYHDSVLDDELQAYSLFTGDKSISHAQKNLQARLTPIFQEHARLNNVQIPNELR
jgi:hypothetical protein